MSYHSRILYSQKKKTLSQLKWYIGIATSILLSIFFCLQKLEEPTSPLYMHIHKWMLMKWLTLFLCVKEWQSPRLQSYCLFNMGCEFILHICQLHLESCTWSQKSNRKFWVHQTRKAEAAWGRLGGRRRRETVISHKSLWLAQMKYVDWHVNGFNFLFYNFKPIWDVLGDNCKFSWEAYALGLMDNKVIQNAELSWKSSG